MLDTIPYELIHQIITYIEVEDVCQLLETSSTLYSLLYNIQVSQAKVRGFQMYDFVMWLEKHRISKVQSLTIYDYNMRNDHCMYFYKEDCDCVEVIKKILKTLEIQTLVLNDCKIDDNDMIDLKWSSKIRKLHLTNYNFESNMKWMSENLPEIRELELNYCYKEYEAFFMPNLALLRMGIQNAKLERFSTNMFFFREDLEVMLLNSCKNENLKVFSLYDISVTNLGDEILDVIGDLYPNCELINCIS